MRHEHTRLFDLLSPPSLSRTLIIHLTREGPADAQTLAQRLALNVVEVEQALRALVSQGKVQITADGQAEVVLGQTRRRTLPARLWPALTTASRLYSAQEIATLRTVVPILQFARAKLSEFADHGPSHALRVKSFATQLGYVVGLTAAEQHLLRAAALFHDVGNIVERAGHHIISQETVEKLTAAGELPFSAREAELVGLVCRWHRKEYDPARCDEQQGAVIRTGLLASLLRVADAMDIDHRRSDYTERFAHVLRFFYPQELPDWTSLEEILGVRICCTPAVQLQVFTRSHVTENLQIALLHKDLASTPLNWSVQQIAVKSTDAVASALATPAPIQRAQAALLAFPFDAHSLVMAALSRQHLQDADYAVELVCYPDTPAGAAWLWQKALGARNAADFAHLLVLNDQPEPALIPQGLAIAQQWQAAGVTVSLLNRHEAQWARVADWLGQGIACVLGGDRAYFWGDTVSPTDLDWGRIAALCMRDPTQAVIRVTPEEEALQQGLLNSVYATTLTASGNSIDWTALAESLLDRIGRNDRAYFINQAPAFVTTYTTTARPPVWWGMCCFATSTLGRLIVGISCRHRKRTGP